MAQYIDEANKAYSARNFKRALELYTHEIATNADSLIARDRAARCLWILRKPADAVAMCEEILGLDSGYALAHVIMAEAYYDMKDFAMSKSEMETAFAMDPSNSEVLLAYGSFLLLDKQYESAQVYLEKAIAADPDNYATLNNLAVIYAAQRNWAKVLHCAKEMYRLRHSLKNFLRLVFAHLEDSKLSGPLVILAAILLIASALLHAWWVWLLTAILLIVIYLLGLSFRGRR